MVHAPKLEKREQYGNAMRIRAHEQNLLRQIRHKMKVGQDRGRALGLSDPALIRFIIEEKAERMGIKVEPA